MLGGLSCLTWRLVTTSSRSCYIGLAALLVSSCVGGHCCTAVLFLFVPGRYPGPILLFFFISRRRGYV